MAQLLDEGHRGYGDVFRVLTWVLIAACLGSGMIAGLFSSFSAFMMKALASLPSAEGMRAMQAINVLIVRPSFLSVFLGTATLCVLSVALSLDTPAVAVFTIAAAVSYCAGCVASTIAFNVPLNNRLAASDPLTEAGEALWAEYLVSWTRWNHVRSVATIVSTILLACAIAST